MGLTPQQVVSGLLKRGVPQNAALGFAGNGQIESGLDPAINERNPLVKGSRGGYGLMQWTGPRRRQLEAFAGSKGRDVSDPETQLDFLAWELGNTEKGAAQAIYAAKTPEEAARLVSERFLRPGIPHLDARIRATAEISGGVGASAAPISGGAGSDTLAGGAGADTLGGGDPVSEIMRMVEERKAAQAAQPQQPTPAEVYQQAAQAPQAALETPDLAAVLEMAMQRRAAAQQPQQVDYMPPPPDYGGQTPATVRQTSNLRGEVSSDILGIAGQAAKGAVFGGGPVQTPASIPLGIGGVNVPIPGEVRTLADIAGNAGTAAAAGLGGAFNYGVGALGDIGVAIGADPGSTARLVRDVTAMPEAFAGSPGSLSRPAAVARGGRAVAAAPEALPIASRVEPTVASIAKPAAAIAKEPLDAAAVGELVRKASSGGLGSKKATVALAAEARVNPEAAAAAERLGLDLPADVLSDHTQIREAVGLTRSVAGSEASAAWRDTVVKAVDRADEVMAEIDGSPDLSSISDRVKRSLTASRDDLAAQADTLYSQVDGAIPRNSQIQPDNVVSALNGAISDLGGVAGLSPAEAKLFKMVTDPDQPVTYERLMREKRLIGKALAGMQGPYGDADSALLNKLYGAMAEDQLASVERIGGPDLRANLELANGIYSKKKALEGSIVDAFGKDLEGSVASKLRIAITQGAKGDDANLNRILAVVPKDLRAEAIASAISSVTRSTSGAAEGSFGFAQYAKTYRGLRQNSGVYATIAKELGPEKTAIMQDLYVLSKKITDARANVLSTGKANQALAQAMTAEGIVEKVFNAGPVRAARGAAGGAAGMAAGGGLGGTIGAAIASGKIGKNRMAAASQLFASEQFQRLAIEAATTGAVAPATVKATANSPIFRAWAKTNKINDPQAWLLGAVASNQAAKEGQQK